MKHLNLLYVIFLSIFICFFVVCFFLFPGDVINASKDGILLWFNSVFPSVFTFIVGANLLIGLGFVDFIGTLLEPVMRPIFNVPGIGAFAVIMGIASGYPVGAKLTVDLRQRNLLTKTEAERLISFSNNSGPLFLLGALGIGMFKSASVGLFILAVHYLSAFATGFLFKFYKAGEVRGEKEQKCDNIFKAAVFNQRSAWKTDGRKFGVLLGDSVRNALDVLIQVGGFIVLFSVIVAILNSTSISRVIVSFLNPIIGFLGFDSISGDGILVGFIEMTNGVNLLSSSTAPLVERIALCGLVIAFSGLSIHAQSIAIISKSDINIFIYICSKVVHSFLAVGFSLLLFPIVGKQINDAVFVVSGFNSTPLFSFFSSLFCFIAAIITFLIIIFFRTFYNYYRQL